MKFHTVNLPKSSGLSQNLIISSTLTGADQSTVPVLLVSTLPLPNTNKNSQWLCGKVGNQCTIPKEFIQKSNKVYIGVFCESCQYSMDVDYTQGDISELDINNQNQLRTGAQLPQLRLLKTTTGTRLLQQQEDKPKYKKLKGQCVSGVAYLAAFVIVCIIGCYIMMNIYVNTKLIKIPLKLGKVEAS